MTCALPVEAPADEELVAQAPAVAEATDEAVETAGAPSEAETAEADGTDEREEA